MPSLRRYGQNDPSSPLALFGLQRTPELLLYFKICCAPPPTALSLCLRLPSSSSSALFIPYLPPERALLADLLILYSYSPSPSGFSLSFLLSRVRIRHPVIYLIHLPLVFRGSRFSKIQEAKL